jgi:hypothetical protein
MALFKDKFQELEENKDINGLIELLNSNKWQHRYNAIVSLINIRDSSAIEEVKETMNDDNAIVRETAFIYLRMNNAFPKNGPDIKLYPINIKNSTKIKRISAHSDKSIDSEELAIDDVNNKLRQEAANLGANAIIELVYEKGIFTLFRGVKGHGNAVFIKDLKNVERKKDSGFIYFFLGIFWILQSNNSESLIFIPVAIFSIIYGIFARWGYKNKTYLLLVLGTVIVSATMWIQYIIKTGFQLYNFNFYFSTAFFIGMVFAFIYEYLRRENDPKMVWKNKWGFN